MCELNHDLLRPEWAASSARRKPHQALPGRAPHLAVADAAFYSTKNEAAAKAKGVKHVCIPN
jgi:hypothetical protein